MRNIQLKRTKQRLQRGLLGAHMLAFLPALCLGAYWSGGEIFLVTFALFTPLLYAVTGGFGGSMRPSTSVADQKPTLDEIAQDFLEVARHNGQTTACFQVGVTGIDTIARTLGDESAHDAGALIVSRLKSTLRDGDHVFQNGENRFVVFIAPGFRLKLDALLDIGKRLRDAVEEPASVSGTTQFLCASMGIASSLNFPRNTTPDTWLASASQALGEAQSNGPSTTRVWSERLSQTCQSRRTLREDLSQALSNGEIQAHFQPQISLHSGAIIGAEALARWEHPKRGCIGPAEFLRALQESGEMENLGKTILVQSLSALRRWDKAGLDVQTISVNFSDVELRNPTLPEHIKWEIDRFGLPAQRLGIEVLEHVISDTDDVIRRNLTVLADMGCRIDLDDFGTGHSSITTLQNFPIQRVKIDRSFVRGADTRAEQKRMLGAVLSMSECLELETLAEGVQTVEENGVLCDLNCQYAQGFLFAKPMSIAAFEDWVGAQQHAEVAATSQAIRRVK